MKLINDFGMIYRVSDRKWHEWLLRKASGQEPEMKDFGTPLGIEWAAIGDWDAERAEEELKRKEN